MHEPFAQLAQFPPTRYQGSKYKLLPWLADTLAPITSDVATVLDAFGGTAAVSYLFKCMGKTVHTNDALRCNQLVAMALIENHNAQLDEDTIAGLTSRIRGISYDNVIFKHFEDIYFTTEENRWLDMVVQNIHLMTCPHQRAMAWWALFQAALSKRPYNLFHRKNLYVRTAKVERSFGNKTTWDKPFEEHFRHFAAQVNAAVFDDGQHHQSSCLKAAALPRDCDLVYLDPPYIPATGSLTKYRDFYHFLEGMAMYPQWEAMIDFDTKHCKLRAEPSPWEQRKQIEGAFATLFERFRDAIIVVSYRRDGLPSIPTLEQMLGEWKDDVTVHSIDYQYALSKRHSQEVLLVAQ